jgi:hypothetical protein
VADRNGLGLAGASTPNEAREIGIKQQYRSLRPPSKQNQAKAARSGRDNPPVGRPRHDVSKAVKPTAATQFAVYSGQDSGQDRLGSYGQAGDAWVAFTRLGIEIGVFASQNEAIVAIERGAKS